MSQLQILVKQGSRRLRPAQVVQNLSQEQTCNWKCLRECLDIKTSAEAYVIPHLVYNVSVIFERVKMKELQFKSSLSTFRQGNSVLTSFMLINSK